MSERAKGARDFLLDNAIVAVTQVILKLRGLLALPLIVKSLGTEGFGLWAQVLSVTTFGGAVLSANLHMGMVRFIAGNKGDPKRIYSSTLACTVALAGLGVLVAVPLSDRLAAWLLGGSSYGNLLVASALLIVLQNVRNLNVNLYRSTKRFVARSVVDFSSVALELGGILVVLRLGYGLLHVVYFMVAWNTVVVVATTAHALTIVGAGAPTRELARMVLKYGVPLVPGALAWWALDRSDRFVINMYLGPRAVGVYSGAYALGALVLHYQAPLQITLMPRVAQYWDTDRDRARRYIEVSIKAFLSLAIPTVVGMPLVAPVALGFLANAEMAQGAALNATVVAFAVLMQGLAIMQTQVFFGANRTGTTSLAMLLAALVNVSATFLLVPRVGLVGAAVATALGYSLLWLLLVWLARPVLRTDHQPMFIVKSVISSAAMVGVLWALRPASMGGLLLALLPAVLVYGVLLLALGGVSATERAELRAVFKRAS
jgi:O-antigen/teichoic acid export membrane protein